MAKQYTENNFLTDAVGIAEGYFVNYLPEPAEKYGDIEEVVINGKKWVLIPAGSEGFALGIISDRYRVVTMIFQDFAKDSDERVDFRELDGSLRTYQRVDFGDEDYLYDKILGDFQIDLGELHGVPTGYFAGMV